WVASSSGTLSSCPSRVEATGRSSLIGGPALGPPMVSMVATTLSVSIQRPPREVHAFVASAPNVPQWAAGLARAVRQDAGGIAESPQGPVRVRFAPPNAYGVADHYVGVAPD